MAAMAAEEQSLPEVTLAVRSWPPPAGLWWVEIQAKAESAVRSTCDYYRSVAFIWSCRTIYSRATRNQPTTSSLARLAEKKPAGRRVIFELAP